jgi:small-conductance mechanosensitive channel
MNFFENHLFYIGGTDITVLSLLIFLVVVIITVIFTKSIKRILLKRVFPRHNISEGVGRSYIRIISYILIIIGILTGLNFAGINITLLFAGSAVLLVGIGFGVQNIVNNFISGVILLFEKPIKEGDFIEIDGMYGTVKSIAARSTRILTNTGIMVIVPNSKLLDQKIVNRSFTENTEIEISVVVSFEEDVEKVKSILIEIANVNEFVLKEPVPSVSVNEFTDNGIRLKLFVWIKEQSKMFVVRNAINLQILKRFREEKIKFPYPQRDVHLINDKL